MVPMAFRSMIDKKNPLGNIDIHKQKGLHVRSGQLHPLLRCYGITAR